MRINIVEDNEAESKRLLSLLRRYEKENGCSFEINAFSDGGFFLASPLKHCDILFLDIELPGGNGMELAEKVRSYDSRVVIIFVTNMAQFAIDGYGVGALDYILKPLKETSFQAKLARAIEAAKRNETQKFSFHSGRKQVVLSVDEIEYVEVSGHDLSALVLGVAAFVVYLATGIRRNYTESYSVWLIAFTLLGIVLSALGLFKRVNMVETLPFVSYVIALLLNVTTNLDYIGTVVRGIDLFSFDAGFILVTVFFIVAAIASIAGVGFSKRAE